MKLLPLLVVFLLTLPTITLANEISIRPFLIDTTLVPREEVSQSIVLTSAYPNRTAVLYATVNEISVGIDGEIKEFIPPVMTDRTNSVTSWIEISRGRIEIPAEGSLEIPISIKIHPFAQPGEYHAFIGFTETKKRADAEAVALRGDANGVIVKVTVADERTETMRISSMVVDRFVTDSSKQQVTITVENAGEVASAPTGEIIFYNNRGFEVAALPVNTDQQTIAPAESKTFTTSIPVDSGLGRFKANANLLYGENQRASLYDSVGFFMLPLYYLYLGIALLSALLLLLFVLIRRGTHTTYAAEGGDDVQVFIRDGHDPKPQDHDIDLKK